MKEDKWVRREESLADKMPLRWEGRVQRLLSWVKSRTGDEEH